MELANPLSSVVEEPTTKMNTQQQSPSPRILEQQRDTDSPVQTRIPFNIDVVVSAGLESTCRAPNFDSGVRDNAKATPQFSPPRQNIGRSLGAEFRGEQWMHRPTPTPWESWGILSAQVEGTESWGVTGGTRMSRCGEYGGRTTTPGCIGNRWVLMGWILV